MKRSDVILKLAPCFRDRFDFSVPSQYQEWLDMVAVAAEPFVKVIADEEIAHRERAELVKKQNSDLGELRIALALSQNKREAELKAKGAKK